MYYYDLHCHTSRSKDSPADVKRTVRVAKKRGIDGIAVTDHNKIYKGPSEIDGVQLIPASEITVRGGHLLAYFINDEILAVRGIKQTVQEIKNQGGYAVLAHPFRKDHGWMKNRSKEEIREVLDILDGIEVGNASDSDEERKSASDVAKKTGIIQTAGSDLHMSGQVGFSVIAVSERLNKDNFKEVMSKAEIIIRPESEIFRKEVRAWKKAITGMARSLGLYNIDLAKIIFFKLIIKNYFRFKNRKFEAFEFNFKKL